MTGEETPDKIFDSQTGTMAADYVRDSNRDLGFGDKVVRDTVTFMPLSWTIVHPIDENSPLYNLTEKDLENADAEILIVLNALDETFAQTVHSRTSYKVGEIRFGHKFASLYNETEADEPITIDVRKLSEIEKV